MSDIPLIKTKIDKSQNETTGLFHLNIEVTEYENIPPTIFVFKKLVNDSDEFVCIANITQLVNYSVNSPAPGMLYFLANKVNLIYTKIKNLLEIEEIIKIDINTLVNNWKLYQDENINTSYTVVFQASGE